MAQTPSEPKVEKMLEIIEVWKDMYSATSRQVSNDGHVSRDLHLGQVRRMPYIAMATKHVSIAKGKVTLATRP